MFYFLGFSTATDSGSYLIADVVRLAICRPCQAEVLHSAWSFRYI